MVSTEKRYAFDNFPVLREALRRGETLYQVRLYAQSSAFLSRESAILRMDVVLALIETRSTVIDAVIKTSDEMGYLVVVCASPARPEGFSALLKRNLPTAVIEEVSAQYAEEFLSATAVKEHLSGDIPFVASIRSVFDSRNALVSLLLEYRALAVECALAAPSVAAARAQTGRSPVSVSLLVFGKGSEVWAIPEFQVSRMGTRPDGGYEIALAEPFGGSIACDDVYLVKEVDVANARFSGRDRRGLYRVSAPSGDGVFTFSLYVPAFAEDARIA